MAMAEEETVRSIAERDDANIAYVVSKIAESVSQYEGRHQGQYHSTYYPSAMAIDVEFPSYVQAVEWARDNAMIADVTVVNPKVTLDAVCSLTFSLMAFLTRGRNAE